MSPSYKEISFINVSMNDLGVLDNSCVCLPIKTVKRSKFTRNKPKNLVSKIMTIAIRSTYYIFCRRNKDWEDPDLMDF